MAAASDSNLKEQNDVMQVFIMVFLRSSLKRMECYVLGHIVLDVSRKHGAFTSAVCFLDGLNVNVTVLLIIMSPLHTYTASLI